MSAEFNWWLLIVGLVAGGALTWLVLADSTRREREIGDEELAAEATWIARTIGRPSLNPDLAEEVLKAHRRYLGFPPPDVLVSPEELEVGHLSVTPDEAPGDARPTEPIARPVSEPDPEPARRA
jgi:hypothetical protein